MIDSCSCQSKLVSAEESLIVTQNTARQEPSSVCLLFTTNHLPCSLFEAWPQLKDTPDFFEKSQYSRVLLIMSKHKKIFFVKILPDSSPIFEANFWGGIPTFHFQKLSREGSQLGHFRNLMTGKVVLSDYQNEDNFRTKIASTFVEGSIESSENRAFDRDLNEGSSIFRSHVRVEILTELWNPWNTQNLAMPKMAPEHQKIADFSKMRF